VAERLGRSPSTVYQWGELGMRCAMGVDDVATFCAATGNDALLQVITQDTHEAMQIERNRGQLPLPGTVTQWDLARESSDISQSVFAAFRDSIVTPRELREIWVQVQEFVGALLRFGATRRKPIAHRARTLADADHG